MSDVIMDGVWVLNINHGQQGGDIATYFSVGALIGGLIGLRNYVASATGKSVRTVSDSTN